MLENDLEESRVIGVKKVKIETPHGFSVNFINRIKSDMTNNHNELYKSVTTNKKSITIYFTYTYETELSESMIVKYSNWYEEDRGLAL